MALDSSRGSAVLGTLTSGVQDISALLPLLGTEQCENHAGSALKKGYLYAAATPMSLFGSLGLARAGFKALIASISIARLNFSGAQKLVDAGFISESANLRLIMIDENDRTRYRAETDLEDLVKKMDLDATRLTMSAKCLRWNIQMAGLTALLSALGIAPYLHLLLRGQSTLARSVQWVLPVMRVLGGFLVATTVQLVIQSRIVTIVKTRLLIKALEPTLERLEVKGMDLPSPDGSFSESYLWALKSCVARALNKLPNASVQSHLGDGVREAEEGRARNSSGVVDGPRQDTTPPRDTAHATDNGREMLLELQRRLRPDEGIAQTILLWTCQFLLLIGILASVAGYVGCFSVVQSTRSAKAPIIWLGLEAALSIIRMILWGLNPEYDNAPPLELNVKLDAHAPLPTCVSSAEVIEREKTLPLVRASEFLKQMTSYGGLLKRFNDPNLTLYYTLTRLDPATSSSDVRPSTERVLYITIFDHTERTTRVYSPGHCDSYFSSAEPVTIDLEHGLVKTNIGSPIQIEGDPIAKNNPLRFVLAKHYQSILNQLDSRTREDERDILTNPWTLKVAETSSQRQGLSEGMKDLGSGQSFFYQQRDRRYLEIGALVREIRDFLAKRGRWVADYMSWVRETLAEDLQVAEETRTIVNVKPDEVREVEKLLIEEQKEMEEMLIDEFAIWEGRLQGSCERLFDELCHEGGINAGAREELQRRLREHSWERVAGARGDMEKRMADGESRSSQRVREAGIKASDEQHLKQARKMLAYELEKAWQTLFDTVNGANELLISSPPSTRLDERLRHYRWEHNFWGTDEAVRERMQKRRQRAKDRLWNEVNEVEARLKRGLERCRDFRTSPKIVECAHSDTKWLSIQQTSHMNSVVDALQRNKAVIHVDCNKLNNLTNDHFLAMARNVTSLCIYQPYQIPDDVQLPPNILSISGYVTMSQEHEDALDRNRSQLGNRTTIEFARVVVEARNLLLHDASHFAIRFLAPPAGPLTLRLVYRARHPDVHLTAEELPDFKHLITHSDALITDEIKIHSDVLKKSSGLSFTPNSRNTLTFRVTSQVYIGDIEMLGTAGKPCHWKGGDDNVLEEVVSTTTSN